MMPIGLWHDYDIHQYVFGHHIFLPPKSQTWLLLCILSGGDISGEPKRLHLCVCRELIQKHLPPSQKVLGLQTPNIFVVCIMAMSTGCVQNSKSAHRNNKVEQATGWANQGWVNHSEPNLMAHTSVFPYHKEMWTHALGRPHIYLNSGFPMW